MPNRYVDFPVVSKRMAAGRMAAALLGIGVAISAAAGPLAVVDDGIPDPLPGAGPGDAGRGRAIVASRQTGLCLLCHSGPIPEERFQGNLAPDLAGAGGRATAAQLRLRIADAARLNPATIMPSYYRTEDLNRVAAGYRGATILSAQQIEDVVAYLQTLGSLPERRGKP